VKKYIIFVLLIVSFIFTNPKTVLGVGLSFGFGGKIVSIPSLFVIGLAATGTFCNPIDGITVTVAPVNATPTEYYIPIYGMPRTLSIPHPGQSIMGKYLGVLPIPCTTLIPTPFGPAPVPTVIFLPAIILSGTSEL
jgi:hypothetical protein